MQCFAKWSSYGLLMGHKKCGILFKKRIWKGPKKFWIFGRYIYIEFLFFIPFLCSFLLWIDWAESFWQYVYGFPQSLTITEINSMEFQDLNFLIFHPILMHFFLNDHLYELLMDYEKNLLFYFQKGSRRGSNSPQKMHIWKVYLTL